MGKTTPAAVGRERKTTPAVGCGDRRLPAAVGREMERGRVGMRSEDMRCGGECERRRDRKSVV